MQIGFIDFSKEERNKVLATLKLLGVQTALDELGVGSIRDAYSDILFPGISTIQTRAKYFVLIPYLFEKASKQKLSNGNEFHRWINDSEDKLVETLLRNSDDEETGIIGKNALRQKRSVKMKPSSIYWNGLRTFEIVRSSGISLSAACNVAWSEERKNDETDIKTDGETFDDDTAGHGNMVLFSPITAESDFVKTASIELTIKEAKFLESRILNATMSKNTLLSYLLKNKMNCNSFDEIPTVDLPDIISEDYQRAKSFADFIIGAHIRYNVIFSNYEDEDMIFEFNEWRTEFISKEFDLTNILERIPCNYATAKFCKDFSSAVHKNDTKAIDELIVAREKAVKGERAKLCKPKEYLYNYDRPVHFYRLDYRFRTAKTIIADIIKGLEGYANV
ncbi:conserved protein of unknown function [Petrocella atlantisensis]|uniref:Uncharacterized protein n=1 Tax=Petrocella atlantisensis TaxID=2173034 RepID=A0A3P7RWY6_9FIRM|nr:DUF6361 family protein [Petrocella atlantisensis]VDN47256.1 conserved protein of unknown function [Petrocella atlantisensis]